MSSAPVVGPTAAAAAPIAAWVATAMGRRAGDTACSSSASAVGTTSAANNPCSARPAINTAGSGANPHSPLKTVKPATPSRNTRRRP
jgi:hypothetical protein